MKRLRVAGARSYVGGIEPSWADRVEERNAETKSAGRWRAIRDFDSLGPSGTLSSGDRRGAEAQPVVSFASNDYLGLTAHRDVAAAAHQAIDRWGTGSGASRLVTGARPVHSELERELADWKGADAALLFPTGFAANLGVISTLAGSGTTVFSDELNHASIIDGCRLGRAQVKVYRHRDVEELDGMLAATSGPSMVVTDTVFSMDGDEAPVLALAEVCAAHGALLVLDDAHAVMSETEGELPCDIVRVGTLSKTLGSLGGFVAGDRPTIDLLVNEARPFIFTTAPSPADTAAALAALRVLRSSEGEALVGRLRSHVERVAPGNPSPIVPILIGEEAAAVAASASLLDRGIFVPAIRPPTVAPGTSRLRVALSAAHTDYDVDRLLAGLRGIHASP
ncbi:MAG: aminotransferase class I/II-fold pyridoxal phosphate-dependent enzyme [Actinomycetota bacterium]